MSFFVGYWTELSVGLRILAGLAAFAALTVILHGLNWLRTDREERSELANRRQDTDERRHSAPSQDEVSHNAALRNPETEVFSPGWINREVWPQLVDDVLEIEFVNMGTTEHFAVEVVALERNGAKVVLADASLPIPIRWKHAPKDERLCIARDASAIAMACFLPGLGEGAVPGALEFITPGAGRPLVVQIEDANDYFAFWAQGGIKIFVRLYATESGREKTIQLNLYIPAEEENGKVLIGPRLVLEDMTNEETGD